MQAAIDAIQKGDVVEPCRLLDANPSLATARVDGCRTLLHVATDWPGHFPNNTAAVALLIAHGADVNAPFVGGRHSETPLHWAASCDDVEMIDTLLDLGADIEARGAVIAGGTPLADATAFGQWKAARRLIERGAQANLWEAATLGLMDRVEQTAPAATPEQITAAFWGACHGGQRTAAQFLLGRGADRNWVGYDGLTPIEAAKRSGAGGIVEWLNSL